MKTLLLILLLVLIALPSYSQNNITNTLGTSGVFTIKDASTNYLTLSQSTGQVNILKTLRLENTTSSDLGIIFKGTDRFLHNYQPSGTLGGNTFLGINAGNFTQSGTGAQSSYNTGIGFYSLYFLTTGSSNTAIGMNSLYCNDGGNYNTTIGFNSLYLLHTDEGSFNTALGTDAGYNLYAGANNTFIGYSSQPSSYSASNQITLGNGYISSLRCAVTTITSLSDARDKKNISDLNLGLDFITKLKPRIFNWDKREWYEGNISDGSKMKESPTAGFIAQELDDAQINANAEWLNLVLKDNPEKWEATPGNLLPIVVKAIQDLKSENDELKSENTELKDRLLKLEQMQNMLAIEIKNIKSKDENLLQVQNNK
jgi:trimeric autotransporter adhesin